VSGGATVAPVDPYPARDYEPIQPRGSDWRGRVRRTLGPVAAGAIALAKWTFILVKFGSIFIAIAAYALLGGWTFAIGFVAMLLCHELGHYIEAKREGLNPKLPVFVPFLFAYVKFTRGNPWQTARVALAGPILGGVASLGILFVADAMHSTDLRYVAYWGFLLNLLNLLPVSIFDGASIVRSAAWLRHGGGRSKATVVYVLYGATALALLIGAISTYVPQHRL